MIDTAMIYEKEESVGKAIAESGVSRSEIFLATKTLSWTRNPVKPSTESKQLKTKILEQSKT